MTPRANRPIRRPPSWLPALAVVAALAGCGEDPVAPAKTPAVAAPGISAALAGDGAVAGFYWLRPIATPPASFPGTFDPQLAPSVEVCEWSGTVCNAVVARMTLAGTPDGRIVVNPREPSYRTTWTVPNGAGAKTYRVTVRLDGRAVGSATIKGLERQVPISFRLEASLRVVGTVDGAGGSIATADDAVRLIFPAGALSQPTAIQLSRMPDAPARKFIGAWEFGPAGTTFAVPVEASFAVDPALLAAVGPAAEPLIIGRAKPTDPSWTPADGSSYDPITGRVSAPLQHFSAYAVVILDPSDVNCARIMGPQVSGTFFSLNCNLPPSGAYKDTVDVAQGSSAQSALLADISRIYGPMAVIGVMASCENNIVGPRFCLTFLTSQSVDPSIAVRGATGLVFGLQAGRTELRAVAGGRTFGVTLVRVGPGATPTRLFTFAGGAGASYGGGAGTLAGGATLTGGRLQLNGSSAYVQLNQRLVTNGSFSVGFFAREAVTQSGYVEFLSQGFSGNGFYVGRDPNGTIRVTDAWPNTGVAMPADHQEHHYAVTHDAGLSRTRLYVDGQLQASFSGAITRGAAGGSDARFGRQFDPFAEYLNGDLDDVSIFGSELSATDVAAIARRQSDLACSAEGSIASATGPATIMAFDNQSGETVTIHWLDFLGNRVLYRTLPAGAEHIQGTFITHPWIVSGVTSGKCYGIWMPITEGRIVRIQ